MSDRVNGAGTVAFDEELALKNAVAEEARVQAFVDEHERRMGSLTGRDLAIAQAELEQLRTRLAHCKWTVKRLTVDENKRLRRGIATIEEILTAVERVQFDRTSRACWLSYGVAAGSDPVLLESLTLAIYALNRGDYNRVMQTIRDRASRAPLRPGEPAVW